MIGVVAGDGGLDDATRQHRLGVERTSDASQHPLRFQQVFLSVKREQIVQVQRHAGTVHQPAIAAARDQIGIAPGGVGRHLIEINIDAGVSANHCLSRQDARWWR